MEANLESVKNKVRATVPSIFEERVRYDLIDGQTNAHKVLIQVRDIYLHDLFKTIRGNIDPSAVDFYILKLLNHPEYAWDLDKPLHLQSPKTLNFLYQILE